MRNKTRDICIDLGLEQCLSCKLTLMKCSILWFRDTVELYGFVKTLTYIFDKLMVLL